jgi:hypothetical protein
VGTGLGESGLGKSGLGKSGLGKSGLDEASAAQIQSSFQHSSDLGRNRHPISS